MKSTILNRSFLDVADIGSRRGVVGAVTGLFAGFRKAAADRALHRQLAEMDDSLLRDIGLGDDEIYRLRQGASVTQRPWA